jgi:hypothetical protein
MTLLDSLNFKMSGKISVACIDLKIICDAFKIDSYSGHHSTMAL